MTGPLRRTLYHVHFVVAALVGGVSFLLISVVGTLYAALGGHRKAAGHFAHAFSALMRFVAGWRFTVEGREHLEPGHPVVYMARHQTNLDVVTVGGIFPFRTAVLGKKEIRKIPLFGWFFAVSGNIFVDRENVRKAIRSLREAAARVVAERLSVWVFPEGTRNPTRTLRPFKKGAFHLAIEAQLPIVPIAVGPVDTLLDAHRWMVRPGRLRLLVLPEISSVGLTAHDVDALVEKVHTAMREGQELLLKDAEAPIA